MNPFEAASYRKNRVNDLMKVGDKTSRRAKLKEIKKDPRYWESRHVQANKGELESDENGDIYIERRRVYRGSDREDVTEFRSAGVSEQTTVGEGVYLTSKPADAVGYARVRAGARRNPVVYEADILNVRLLDLRNEQVLKKWLPKFRALLSEELEQAYEDEEDGKDVAWDFIAILQRALDSIDEGVSVNNLQLIFAAHGELLTNYLKDQGYDGILALEGGEGDPDDVGVGNHDSFVIFDPKKIKIVQKSVLNQNK